MSLVLDSNSYQDVVGAEVYFATRLASTAWIEASTSDKEAALCTSTRMLDELSWKGQSVSPEQPLAFPRYGEYFDTRQGYVRDMSPTPLCIKVLCCELALHILGSVDVLSDTGRVMDFDVGGVSLSRIQPPPRIPPQILKGVTTMLNSPTGLLVFVGA